VTASAGLLGGDGERLEARGGGQTATSGTTATPKRGGHVTEGWANDVRTFNPLLSSDVYSNICIGLCLDGLLKQTAAGDLIPSLAQLVPNSGTDQSTYVFKLKPNIRWSDGTPLTSDDVLFTYNIIFAPEYAVVSSPRRGDFTQHVASISAPDPGTFVIKTRKPYAPLLASHGLYGILPKHVLGNLPPAAINNADYNSAPTVTSGAFKFVRWDKGSQVVFARNPTYYAGAARLDSFVFKVVGDTVAVANRLKTREIDVGQIDSSQLRDIRAMKGITVKGFNSPSIAFYGYQLDPARPAGQVFQDPVVRQALLYAVDRKGIVKSVQFGHGRVANSVEPPTSWAWNPNTKPTYVYNPDKANKMLEQAGWVKGADGIRAKGGRRMSFTMTGTAGSRVAMGIAQVIQQNWKTIGVEMTPRPVQFAQMIQILTQTHDFDLVQLAFTFGSDPDQSQFFSSSGTGPGGFNGFPFKNAEADRLQAQAAAVIDHATRKKLYFQYQDLMAQEIPVPVLFFPRFNWGLNNRVQGYGPGPFNQHGTRPWMKDVWVKDGK
jgi:peptide/nickel transport system substrate-binding protein